MRGLFVTGTDTGVGKTVVAAALAAALRARGLRVGVMKPVESGCPREMGGLVAQDAQLLIQASGCISPLEHVVPYSLEAALAPALAAEREGVQIDLRRIERCFGHIARDHDVVVVEGAGGLLTPFSGSLTMRDLAVALGLPALIVVRNVLGAISHAALTVEAAQIRGLDVAGLVLNDADSSTDDATMTNRASLERWGGARVIGHVPYIPASDGEAPIAAGRRLLDCLGDWPEQPFKARVPSG